MPAVEGEVVLDVDPPHPGRARARPGVPVELQGRQVRFVLGRDQRHAQAHVHDPHGRAARGRARRGGPMRTFPIIRDLVTDVSFNYTMARQVPPLKPRAPEADGTYRMQQIDIERGQEFRKCIECFMCQDVCHVIRDHEENKATYAGPALVHPLHGARVASARHRRPARAAAPAHGSRHVQHHQVLHRGLPRAHQDHRQRHHPA